MQTNVAASICQQSGTAYKNRKTWESVFVKGLKSEEKTKKHTNNKQNKTNKQNPEFKAQSDGEGQRNHGGRFWAVLCGRLTRHGWEEGSDMARPLNILFICCLFINSERKAICMNKKTKMFQLCQICQVLSFLEINYWNKWIRFLPSKW